MTVMVVALKSGGGYVERVGGGCRCARYCQRGGSMLRSPLVLRVCSRERLKPFMSMTSLSAEPCGGSEAGILATFVASGEQSPLSDPRRPLPPSKMCSATHSTIEDRGVLSSTAKFALAWLSKLTPTALGCARLGILFCRAFFFVRASVSRRA
jgi:hypothetical protein